MAHSAVSVLTSFHDQQDPNSTPTPCSKLKEKMKLVSGRGCYPKSGNSLEINFKTEPLVRGQTYTSLPAISCLERNHYEHQINEMLSELDEINSINILIYLCLDIH